MVRVYIHGRPQGQDIWSATPVPDDDFYLNPFLDSQIGKNLDAVLQIDLWNKNAYYSYIHRRNVVEKVYRPNAYLAITVCFEKQVCTQVATLYDLLRKVYSQLCLNSIIEKDGDQEHFLVAKLNDKEDILKQITSVIQQNVEKHIASSLEPISSNASDTTQSKEIKRYSILDVDSPQFLMDCKTNRVLVSQDYPSKDSLALKFQQQLQKPVKVKIKSSKANANLTEKSQPEIINEMKEQNKQLQQSTEQSPEVEASSKPSEKIIHEIPPVEEIPDTDIQEQSYKPTERIRRMAGRFRVSNTTITLVATLFNSVLLVVIVAFLSLEGIRSDSAYTSRSGDSVKRDTIVVHTSHNISVTPIEMMPDYSKARIDIPNLSAKEKNLKIGETYTLAIQNAPLQDYQWVVEWQTTGERNGILVDNDQLIVTKVGEITISCIDSHNYIVKQRKIKVQ